MRFLSLEARIITLFISLLLVLQLLAYGFIDQAIDKNARKVLSENLQYHENVFQRLIEKNAQNLVQAATIVAKDYALRDAISSNDIQTIVSALLNHGERINADLTMLVGLDGKIIAASSDTLAHGMQDRVQQLMHAASNKGGAANIVSLNGRPYQLVMVPVLAPVAISWVALAVPVDQVLVREMHELSPLQVSIVSAAKDGAWEMQSTSLTEAQGKQLLAALPRALPSNKLITTMHIDRDEYSSQLVDMNASAGQHTVAVLQLSFSRTVAPYKLLQRNLLILSIVATLLAIIISAVTARRITNPLRQLSDTARRFAAGNYQGEIAIRRSDEIGALAKSFSHMRDAIATREKEISRLAYWDTLTHLPNRALFTSMLNDALAAAATRGDTVHVLMLDLDRFKYVNDLMGHEFGDQLLTEVAQRLSQQLGAGKPKPARLGGDEFAVLLPASTLEEAQQTARAIAQSFERPIAIGEQNVDIGAGIGIAAYPAHASDAASLMSRVEVAMYAAKRARQGAVTYSPEIDKSSQKNLSLLSDMRAALGQNQFQLWVQPKVSLSDYKLIGVEALVRWVHPERGMVFPDQFIPFAEQSGFIRSLTHWIMDQAAQTLKLWQAQDIALKMSVNISTMDLMDQDLPQKFAAILDKHALATAQFCLEITESAIMDDPVRAHQTLDNLHAMGMDLSIDDFGTGYSSLAYLKQLPVNELKIDKSFVLKMDKDNADSRIVKSTIDLAHNMQLRVVAEGVENQQVMQLLRELGCDQVQGYFLNKPMPASQLPAWKQDWEQRATQLQNLDLA